MEKKNYATPTVSYVGPDIESETNTPIILATVTVTKTTIISMIW